LAFSLADELTASFWHDVPATLGTQLPTSIGTRDGYAALVSTETIPAQFYARAVLHIEQGTTEAGILLRASADADQGYILRLEPKRGRMVFDRWPRRQTGEMQWQISGDVPFAVELERPCTLEPGEHTLEVVVDGNICVAVLDRQVVLSARMYDHIDGHIGVFAGEGSATVCEFIVRQRSGV
jgi:beta-fructofuranosidase